LKQPLVEHADQSPTATIVDAHATRRDSLQIASPLVNWATSGARRKASTPKDTKHTKGKHRISGKE